MKSVKFFVLLVCLGALAACTSVSSGEGKPVPAMTFDHIVPLKLDVRSVEIENRYDTSSDMKDVSSSFPTPPDIMLKSYAESRFKAAGNNNSFRFVIEESFVHEKVIEPEGTLMKWMNMGAKDHFDMLVKLRLYTVSDAGQDSAHTVLSFKHSVAIPQSKSLAERELEQFKFLEMFMVEVDQVLTKTLQDKMGLVSFERELTPIDPVMIDPEDPNASRSLEIIKPVL